MQSQVSILFALHPDVFVHNDSCQWFLDFGHVFLTFTLCRTKSRKINGNFDRMFSSGFVSFLLLGFCMRFFFLFHFTAISKLSMEEMC